MNQLLQTGITSQSQRVHVNKGPFFLVSTLLNMYKGTMYKRVFGVGLIGLLGMWSCSGVKEEKVVKADAEVRAPQTSSLLPAVELQPQTEVKAFQKGNLNAIGVNSEKLTLISKTSKRIPLDQMLKTSVSFTENKGQLERFQNFSHPLIGNVKFYSKAFCGNAYFGTKGIAYSFSRLGLRDADFAVNGTEKESLTKAERKEVTSFALEFLGANANPEMNGREMQHTKFNFLKGNNPDLFIKDVSSYQKVFYQDLYPGIDMVYYDSNDQLKYDYIVAPGADVASIQVRYHQVKSLALNQVGELEIGVEWGTLVDRKPYSYQMVNGKKKEVKVVYKLIDASTIGFEIKGNYDAKRELIIDPYTVAWSSYIGTATSDNGYLESTCMDNAGRTLGTGWTNNAFPISASPNGYDKTTIGDDDAFVFRMNAAGSALDYVSYLGGNSIDIGTAISVNSAGEICVSGLTSSYLNAVYVENAINALTVATGPTTIDVVAIAPYGANENLMLVNGANVMYGQINGFVDGNTMNFIVASTIGSGTMGGWQIYRLSQMPFPTTADAIQLTKTGNDGLSDIFYCKLNGAGNNLTYGTYYGGSASNIDWALDMALDAAGNAYITGRTQTTAGFTTSGVYKTAPQGGYDGFVLKINSNNTLGYCTYVGGAANDVCKGIVASAAGEVYVAGMTASSSQATGGAFQTAHGGVDDGFVVKLSTTGTVSYFTYLGGIGNDGACGIDLAPASNEVVVVGSTNSANFPMQNAFDNSISNMDGFLTRINATGTALVYSTYIGGDGQDNTKGFDYNQYHKNGGVKLSAGELPVSVFGMASSAASLSAYLISPITFNTVNQSGGATSHNGGTYSGMDDWFISVFSANAQTALFGMLMGGTDNDYPTAGINIDLTSACVTFGGGVHSLPFPVTPGAFQTQRVNTTTPDQSTVAKICLTEILPVQMLYFNAVAVNGDGHLSWATANEKNNRYFEVQKSDDGIHFYTIGKVDGNGTTNTVSEYTFVDEDLNAGTSYYRLKQVDEDGNYRYSEVRSLTAKALEAISVSPNPGNGIVEIHAQTTAASTIHIQVQSALGQLLLESSEEAYVGGYTRTIDLTALASGVYIIQVKAGGESQVVRYVKE